MRVFRRWLPVLAVVGLLIAAGAAASSVALPLYRAPVNHQPAGQLEQTSPAPLPTKGARPGTTATMPAWVDLAFAVIGAVIAIVILWFLFNLLKHTGSRFRRRTLIRRTPQPPANVEEELLSAVDAGLSELREAESDPRRVVIACWVRLERAAASAGTQRLPGDTSTDLVLRLLAGHRLSETVLTGFADVYRAARYASHDVDERTRDQARAALGRLRDELASRPGEVPV